MSQQYNLNERSIYNLFNKYDKELIDIIIETFKKEQNAPRLLKKQFSNSFNGENITFLNNLDYMETNMIQGVLSRFEDRLKVSTYLLSRGKTKEDIKKMFYSKKDIEISNIVKNYLNKMIAEDIYVIFKSLETILNKYDITIIELQKVIEKIPEPKKRLVFIYTYIDNKSVREICSILKIKENEYNAYLEQAKKAIYLELENGKTTSAGEKKVKAKIKLPKLESKPLDMNVEEDRDKYKKRINEELLKAKAKNSDYSPINDVGKTTRKEVSTPSSFYELFYSKIASLDERKIIKSLIDNYFKENDDSALPILKKMYCDTLDSRTDYVPSVEQNMKVIQCKKALKSYIDKELSKKEIKLKESFYDYFITPDISEETLDELKQEILDIVTKSKYTYKDYIYKFYGKSLSKKLTNPVDYKEGRLVLDIIEKLRDSIRIKESFYDYFITQEMSELEKDKTKEKVLKHVNRVESKSSDLVKKLYTDSLDSYTGYVLPKNESVLFQSYIKTIKKQLLIQSIEYDFKAVFYDYFITPSMSNSEKNEIKKSVDSILFSMSLLSVNLIKKIYGPSLDELQVYNLTENQKNALFSIVKNIKNKMLVNDGLKEEDNNTIIVQPNKKISKEEIKKLTKKPQTKRRHREIKKSFYDYFIDENTEDKEAIKKQVKQLFDKSKSKEKQIVLSIYGANLDEFNEEYVTKGVGRSVNILSCSIRNSLNITMHNLKNNLYDYFINEEVSQAEKNNIKEIIRQLIIKSKIKEKYILIKIYGTNLNEFHNLILTKEEKKDFNLMIEYIQNSLNQKKEEKEEKNIEIKEGSLRKSKRKNLIGRYYRDDEIYNRKVELLLFKYIYQSTSSNKEKLLTLVGPLLNEYHIELLSKEDIKNIRTNFINPLRLYINKMITIHPNYGFKSFICEKQRNGLKEARTLEIINEYISKLGSNEKELLTKVFGDDLDTVNNVVLTNEELKTLFNIYKDIYSSINKEYIEKNNGIIKLGHKIPLTLFDSICNGSMSNIDKRRAELITILFIYNTKSAAKDVVYKKWDSSFTKAKDGKITSEESKSYYANIISPIFKRVKVNKDISFKDVFGNINISVLDKYEQGILIKVFGPNLDTINDVELNDEERIFLFKTFDRLSKLKEISIKQSFFDNFITDDMSDEEKRVRIEKVKLLISRIHPKNKDIITRIYGETYDKLCDTPITNREVVLLNNSINIVNNYLRRSDEEKKIEYYPSTFYDYFIDDSMDEEEKNRIKEKVKYYYDCSDILAKDVVKRLYTDSLDYYTPSILDSNETHSLKRYIASIKKFINNEQRKISNGFICKSFYDYFMNEDNQELKDKIDNYMAKTKSDGKDIVIKVYGPTYDSRTDYILTKEEKKELFDIVNGIKKSLSIKKMTYINNSFYDYFIDDSMNEEEKNKIKESVLEIIKKQSVKCVEIITKIYGPNYDFKTDYKLEPLDYYYLKHLVAIINNSLNNKPSRRYNTYDLPTFYDYFEGYTDEESKRLIKLYFDTSKSRGKKATAKIYDKELNYVKNDLSSKEKEDIKNFIGNIKLYIEATKERMANNGSSKEDIVGKEIARKENISKKTKQLSSFLDYFVEDSMTEEEKTGLKKKVKQYIDISKQHLKDLVIKAYGPNYDSYNGYIYTPEERRVINYFKQNIRHSKLNVPTICNTFYDHFITEGMDESEIEFIKLCVKKYFYSSNSKGKMLVSKVCDEDFNYIEKELSSDDKKVIKSFISNTRFYIKSIKNKISNNDSSLEEKLRREIIRKEGISNPEQQVSSFFDFFIESSMSEDEITDYKKKIKQYIDTSKKHLKDLVIKAYGLDYDSYNGYIYTKEEKKVITYFKQNIKHSKLNVKFLRNTFYDYFITEDMDESDIESIKAYVKRYLDNSKSTKKDAVLKVYGPTYDKLSNDVGKDIIKEVSKFASAIKREYKNSLVHKSTLRATKKSVATKDNTSIDESSSCKNNTFKIDIYKLVPNAHLLMNNDLLDINIVEELTNNGGIVDVYEQYKDSYKLLEEYKISKDSLISIYLKYLPLFNDISEIIKFIVLNTSDVTIIQNILSSGIFDTESGYLTDKEKEIIYLKLLQLRDNSITNEVIAKITGLTTEEIINYNIVTHDDRINSINKALKNS